MLRCPAWPRPGSAPTDKKIAVIGAGPAGVAAAAKLASLGHESSALGVARIHAGIVDTFVLDTVDAAAAPAVEALGLRPVVTDTIMTDDDARARLARETLAALA